MIDFEEKILKSINLKKGMFGLEAGALVLQKTGKDWKPGVVIGSKEQDHGVQFWTAEEEGGREIKYVCWDAFRKPLIKIVKNTAPKELTIKNLIGSLREFSREAKKIGIKNILAKASDISITQ